SQPFDRAPIRPGQTIHRYVRKGVPEKLCLVLYDEDHKPRNALAYRLVIGDVEFTGRTDGGGRIGQPLPPNAGSGTLFITSDGIEERYSLRLGDLDPISEISGIQGRLRNLGFPCPTNGVLDS